MTSILTNTSSMIALQTLRGINSNLNQVQSEISTGKTIATAKDNAAIWAISKVMESDVAGFEAISSSLDLGESSVGTASAAAEEVESLLKQMKGAIVAAQEENVDRGKIQKQITNLTKQIQGIVDAAQFNGLNLIDGLSSDDVTILSSLNRAADGTVTAGHIDVSRFSLSTTGLVAAQGFGTTAVTTGAAADYLSGVGTTGDAAAGTAADVTEVGGTGLITVGQVKAGMSYRVSIANMTINTADGKTAVAARDFEYVASAEDGAAEVADNLVKQMSAFFAAATNGQYEVELGGTDGNEITLTNNATAPVAPAVAGDNNLSVSLMVAEGGTPAAAPASQGLAGLNNIDVTTSTGATQALVAIEGYIQTSIDAAAEFGASAARIESQVNFVSKMVDSLKTGVGAMVDADMEEASARLQALQVQQQLGIQSLSIANAAPQSVLRLFQ